MPVSLASSPHYFPLCPETQDPLCESLLHLHERSKWTAKRGAGGAAAPAAIGDRRRAREAPASPALRIPVPPGTVVRRKRGAILLGDLTRPGQQLLVAQGGRGGLGAKPESSSPDGRPPAPSRSPLRGVESSFLAAEAGAEDGSPGEEVGLQLLLRVVADAGIVGLPNAGKSSLLAAITRASPDIAPYPFTTLMPNLGVVSHGDPSLGGSSSVLADLPGLIRRAHKGVGLGRAFLRHLRRTRALVVVVDASAEGPLGDYLAVREELRLYNPEYCTRPHIVVLNKVDALRSDSEGSSGSGGDVNLGEALLGEFAEAAEANAGLLGRPSGIFLVSALTGEGLKPFLGALGELLRDANDADHFDPELVLDEAERQAAGLDAR